MTRRQYLYMLLCGSITAFIVACRKDKKTKFESSKLVLTNSFPSRVFANQQLRITWKASYINSIDINFKIGAGSWRLLDANINPALGEHTITFPSEFIGNGLLTIAIKGGILTAYSPPMEKFNIVKGALVNVDSGAEGNVKKRLEITNSFPDKVYANDQLHISWTAHLINSIDISYKIGNGPWLLLATQINPDLGHYTIWFPAEFIGTGLLTIALDGGIITTFSPPMQKFNAFVIETSLHPELTVVGGMKSFNISSNDVFIKRQSAASIKCFSSACTHAGCPISFLQSLNKFNCSCHGSQFDADGNVLQGPASLPLNTFVCETLASEKFRVIY